MMTLHLSFCFIRCETASENSEKQDRSKLWTFWVCKMSSLIVKHSPETEALEDTCFGGNFYRDIKLSITKEACLPTSSFLVPCLRCQGLLILPNYFELDSSLASACAAWWGAGSPVCVFCGWKPASNPLAVALIDSEVGTLMLVSHCHGEEILDFPLLELNPLKCLYLPSEVIRGL